MARRSPPWYLIPLFFNVVLLAGVPFFRGEPTGPRLISLLVLGLAWPWIMAFIVGRVVDFLATRQAASRRDGDDPDFV